MERKIELGREGSGVAAARPQTLSFKLAARFRILRLFTKTLNIVSLFLTLLSHIYSYDVRSISEEMIFTIYKIIYLKQASV